MEWQAKFVNNEIQIYVDMDFTTKLVGFTA